jgi:parvulin-like peptidyl-prolyl isomerase
MVSVRTAKSKEKTASLIIPRFSPKRQIPGGLPKLPKKVALHLNGISSYKSHRNGMCPGSLQMEVQMKLSLRILISVTGALFVAVGAPAQPPAQAPNVARPVAVVNGEPITKAELDAVLKASRPSTPTPLTAAQEKEMQTTALNLLIEDLLMRQYLRKNAQPASPQEIDKELQELNASLVKDKQTLTNFLQMTGQNETQLRADIAARLQWKGFITPRLTEQVVKQYYDTNKVFFDKVMVRASHVLITVKKDATQNDKQMLFNRIQAIRQEILTGKISFQDAAKKYSDCPSKDNGGDIGLFPYKFAVAEPFAKAAFSMKVGEMSDVVATEFGYHIIKVTDKSAGQPSNFEAIKLEVKEIYAQEIYQYIITEQRKVSKIES